MQNDLTERELVHSIVGGFFDVYNYYGYGLVESVSSTRSNAPSRSSADFRVIRAQNSCKPTGQDPADDAKGRG
jgi:hypothetical protein